MNNFQILALILFTLLLSGTVATWLRKWITGRECFLWCCLWLAAVVTTAWPELTSIVAGMLGIGRGADLVSYLGIAVMLIGFWMVYVRLLRLRRELTLLVREIAILEARREQREPR